MHVGNSSFWYPLLAPSAKKIYEEKLSEISEAILKNSKPGGSGPGLMTGVCGLSIFYCYYARHTKDKTFERHAEGLISFAFDQIEKGFLDPTFYSGLAGIGWTAAHLADEGFLDPEAKKIAGPLNGFLLDSMIGEIERGNYDFLHGALGIGFYFLNRLSDPNVRRYLERLVDGMEKLIIQDASGEARRESVLDQEKETRGFNLGLFNAMSGIVVLLSQLVRHGICEAKASSLLKHAVRFILERRQNPAILDSSFPPWVGEGYQPAGSRVAWCHGDLGVGVSLRFAAESMGEAEWYDHAIDILRRTASRQDAPEMSVFDAGLYHGAAGLAHVYNRLFRQTGVREFREAALNWAAQALNMANHPEGYAGYSAYHAKLSGGWYPETGLLSGIAGIGLALISLLSGVEPSWDSCFLLS